MPCKKAHEPLLVQTTSPVPLYSCGRRRRSTTGRGRYRQRYRRGLDRCPAPSASLHGCAVSSIAATICSVAFAAATHPVVQRSLYLCEPEVLGPAGKKRCKFGDNSPYCPSPAFPHDLPDAAFKSPYRFGRDLQSRFPVPRHRIAKELPRPRPSTALFSRFTVRRNRFSRKRVSEAIIRIPASCDFT